MKKRLFSLFTIVIMIISLVGCLPVTSASAETYGDFSYDFVEPYDGTIEITSYSGENTKVIIPSTINGYKVTKIGSYCFSNVFGNGLGIISVNIPYGVTSIGSKAFYGCDFLRNISLPNTLINIEENAFESCESITQVNIPKSVSSIGNSAFIYCTSLKSIIIPYGVKKIENSAFESCTNLSNVTIAESVIRIGDSAFKKCSNLKSVNIKNGVISIGMDAFTNCNELKSITIPKSVNSIGYHAFGYKSWWESTVPGFTIYGYTGTAAQRYAVNNDIIFKVLNSNTTRNANAVAKNKSTAKKAMKQAKIVKLTVKSKVKKQVNVSWKKVKKAKGYQVQVSTKNNFHKLTYKKFTTRTKIKIKNKKIKSKKTYYVRVRAYATYKDINNATRKVYSKWNKKLRKVKVK